jgi:hypothetical protein
MSNAGLFPLCGRAVARRAEEVLRRLAAQSANCKFFFAQFSLGFAAIATDGQGKC